MSVKDKFDIFSNKFAYNIFKQKYSMDGQETWADTCNRVVENVCGQLLDNEKKEKILQLMLERKFIPGGRYLYASGRPMHQVNNCFLFRVEDSREGWADTMYKATSALMTGGGIGFDYSALRGKGAIIKKTGGTSTGPIALMEMVNEAGRYIMQGGNRRSAICAGLNWKHPDIFDFIDVKNWDPRVKALKEEDFTFPAKMEGTNISVIYDTEFFVAIEDKKHENHKLAKQVWEKNCRQAFTTAEPGMSMNFLKDNESLRNAPISADTNVLTVQGYQRVGDILNESIEVWTGKRWASTIFKKTKENVETIKVNLSGGRSITCDPEHEFLIERYKGKGDRRALVGIDRVPAEDLQWGDICNVSLPEISKKTTFCTTGYTLGYIYGDGSFHRKYPRAELTMCTEESKGCLPYLSDALTTSITSKDNRGYTRVYFKNDDLFKGRNKSIFPYNILTDKTQDFKTSFIAGLFDSDGNYFKPQNRVRLSSKHEYFLHDVRRLLESLGILSSISTAGISSYGKNQGYTLTVNSSYVSIFSKLIPCKRLKVEEHNSYRSTTIKVLGLEKGKIQDVFCCDVGHEEHSFMAEGVIISNCTEVTSEDDSDKCNLGTLWINRFENKEEFAEAVKYATYFLLCGGIYSLVPTEGIKEVGLKNNRIGLGLGGIHEWLMLRGSEYEVTPELHKWLNLYEQESDSSAFIGAKELGVATPKGKRAIAPTGTIGILAETTTGIEPLFCKAYKRRYLDQGVWKYEYVIDGAVKRLLEAGVPLEKIKDSGDITFKQRVKFQADVQNYVDMAISSTCNLTPWGSEANNDESLVKNAKMLLKYAKRLRGFTCYPDGARGGQPLTRVELDEAMKQEGKVFEEKEVECVGGVCGV